MKKILIGFINLYQKIPGPWHNTCRHIPTCSNYAKLSIETHGVIKGSFLGIKRILKCNPLGSKGFDPVPEKIERTKKMKLKKFSLMILTIGLISLTTGCKQDDMEDINIIVTNYPNEYIISELYQDHAHIESIYPDGIDIDTYKITTKMKKKVSTKDLFIYNGLIEKERNLAVELLDLNSNLKIIDTAYVLESNYSPEELWLNPSSLLMMTQNVRLGLKEYITSTYLRKDIDKKYNKLKIALSELDADYRVTIENTKNKTIVTNNSALKYLEKFGLSVICLDNDATEKTLNEVKTLIRSKAISYIYLFEGEKLSDNSKEIIKLFPDIKPLELHKIMNLSDQERDEENNYLTLMNKNLELLKQELYQ